MTECKLIDFNVSDKEEFVIQMFGIDESRKTYSISIYDYTPFIYIRVGNDWTTTKCDEFIEHLKNHENGAIKYSFKKIVSYEMVSKKSLYGFDGGKFHKFIYIRSKNMKFIYAIKQLYYIKETQKV